MRFNSYLSRMVGIYKMMSPSNKVYIGQSWNINERKKRYKCKSRGNNRQIKIHNSLVSYGFESHNFEVIHELPEDVTQEVMDDYETLYWQLYIDCGFEMLNIKEPGSRGKPSEESRLKMSKAKLGVKHSPERNLQKSQYQRGRKQSPELVEKRASKLRGLKRSAECRERYSQLHKGIVPVIALAASILSRMRKVNQLSLSGDFIKEWDSATIAGEALKIDSSTISKCCRKVKNNKSAGKFRWEFVEGI